MGGTNPLPSIRAARPQDVAALAYLGERTFCDTFAHLYAPKDLAPFLEQVFSDAAIARQLAEPNREYRVAENADGALIGYAKINHRLGLDYDPAPRRALELSQLYLLDEAKATGLADAFMAWVEDEAHAGGYDEIALSVYCDNTRAQKFYARHGYAKFADSFFMVGNHRDDEFLFRKDVTPRT